MSRRRSRFALPAVAAGLVALALPMSSGQAAGAASAVGAAEGETKFGYSAQTSASPVYIEIYEPTIPIPATPQAELQFGYTKVVADSSSARGRASFLWPGDAVGEGLKTIVENLGLPPEISAPIAERGYPAQVNSGFPSGPAGEANEPIPGSVMRTGSTEKATYAQSGYSTTCDTSGGEEGGTGGDPGIPGLPEVPGLPELPGLPIPGLDALLGALTPTPAEPSGNSSRTGSAAAPAAAPSASPSAAAAPAECQIPAQLSALVSFGGFEAFSFTERTGGAINSVSRTAVGDVSLLGGVITMSGVKAKVTSTSDGKTPSGKGKASYGSLNVAGQEFTIGPDGVQGAGQSSPIPGLPDDPAKALTELGVTITVPTPTFERDGKEVKSLVEGLVVTIDTKTLATALRTLALGDLLNQLPEEAKDLKKALGAALGLSPKIVVHLARATSKLETADPIDIPDVVPDNDPEAEEDPAATGGGTGGTGGTTGGAGTTTPAAPTDTAPGTATEAVAELPAAELASGLPPLFSIPGLLLVGGIAGAVAAGSYVRRMGALALGGGAACSHGLDTGLPDLRKVQ